MRIRFESNNGVQGLLVRPQGGVRMLIGMTIPLTGTQHEIEAGDYRATVTELGAGLRSLTFGDRALTTTFDADELPPHGAGQLLTPWPNRINGGQYEFDGARYQVALSEPAKGNAIHGLTRFASWTRVAHEPGEVTLRSAPHGAQGYPFAVQVDATYRLDAGSGLHVTITATNKGSRPAPWGAGTHPYLTADTTPIDDWELELPADKWQPVDDRLIPSGPAEDVTGTPYDLRSARKLAGLELDHAFTGLRRDADGLAWVRLRGSDLTVAMWMDASNKWLQAFTGDALEPERRRMAVAVEPMTCPPDAFASGEDLIVLQPKESVTVRWGIRTE
jgi:aldose 1-epimerase